MSFRSSRREFIRSAAVTGLGAAGLGSAAADRGFAQSKSPNERVNIACIGVGGKGDSDSNDAGRLGNVVAICDVDENTLAKAAQRFPLAKKYTDYRKMLDEMGKSIDAVTVSTPDHNHGPAAAMAMNMGKHAFCQKPLTHSLWEARELANIATRMKVATQMGNQGTADSGMRKNAYLVKSGVLGKVTEVHVWTNRPIWPQGGSRPAPAPVPAGLHWDTWIGPAPDRPYAPNAYHTFAWRGWWDFGTGALGDMACHTMNLPFMGLDLRNPISVEAHTSGHNRDSYPNWSTITYEFGPNGNRPGLKMFWYDGGKLPNPELFKGGKFEDLVIDGKLPSSGSLIIGDKDQLYTPGDYGGGGRFIHSDPTPVPFPESPGHFEEFIRACKGGEPAMSNFPNYAVPLTETVLLGNLAVWADGKKIEWDAKNLKAKNAPEVDIIIHPRLQHGYSLNMGKSGPTPPPLHRF
jgi:predicted dehydrogenase